MDDENMLHVLDLVTSLYRSPFPPPSDSKLQTVPLDDTEVSSDTPRVGLEEMLQQMSISESGRGDGGGIGDGGRGDGGRSDGEMGGEEMVTE